MAKKLEPLLLLKLKSSQRLKRLIVVIHMLALVSSMANALPVAIKLALLTGICLHFCYIMAKTNGEHLALKHTEASEWEISDHNDFASIQILNSTVITVFAIFLHFTQQAQRKSIVIMNDTLSKDEYRRLIVRLQTAAKK